MDLLLVEVAREAHFLNQQGKLEVGRLEQICVPGDADLLKQLLLAFIVPRTRRPGQDATFRSIKSRVIVDYNSNGVTSHIYFWL